MEEVNLPKSQCQAFTFHLFFGAAKACLFPFLALYMRYLGLNATQTGLVLGAKSVATMLCAPCWTRCSKYTQKKRFVLILSLIFLIGSYLLLTLIPPVNKELSDAKFCLKASNLPNTSRIHGPDSEENIGFQEKVSDMDGLVPKPTTTTTTSTPITSTAAAVDLFTTEQMEYTKRDGRRETSITPQTTAVSFTTEGYEEVEEEGVDKLLKKLGLSIEDMKEMDPKDIQNLINKLRLDEGNGRSKRDAAAAAAESSSSSHDSKNTTIQDHLYDSMASLMNTLSGLPSKINTVMVQEVFWSALAVIVVGELFSAPTDKLSDDMWFEFLDGVDMLEKYGSHKLWGCIGFALIPPVITAAIDHMPCLLPYQIPRITLHFYSFGGMAFLALMASCCYPVFVRTGNSKKVQRPSRCFKGLRILMSGPLPMVYTVTMILLGVLQGCLATFLFWKIQDVAGSELIMGLSLTSAFVGEFFLLLIQRCLVRKMGNAAGVIVGLLFLSLRFVFYSFLGILGSPWLVLAGEGLTCISSSLVRASVEDVPEFRLNPLVMDRSAKGVLTSLYQGLGLAVGSVASGLVYDWMGVDILFQACAVLAGTWIFVFGIVVRCAGKSQKVRYAKLLQEDEDNVSDGSMEYDDDWLEVAMQHHR